MATINDITNASSYKGQPEAGGSLGIGITIDNTPLQRLATFTYYRDRDLWQKRQQQDAIAAKMIADIAAFDTNSPFTQYRDDLIREANELQSELRKDPSMTTYDRNNPQKWLDLHQRIGRFENKRKRATINDTLYNSDKAAIELIIDPAERDLKRRELDDRANELFTGGIEEAYSKQFESSAPIKQSDYEIPSVALKQSSFIIEEPNKDFTVEVTHGDPDDLMAKAQILAAGVPEDIREKDWFKRLSPNRQKLALERNELASSKRRAIQALSLQYKKSLEEWKLANKDIDINTVDVNTLPDGIIEDNIRAVKLVNQQIDELNQYVVEGRVKDKAGRVKTTPYAKINFADGLDEAELIVMESLQRNKNSLITKVDKKIQPTDDELQRRGQNLDFQVAWQNATKPSAEAANPLKDAIENPAILFGRHVNRLKERMKKIKPGYSVNVPYSKTDEDTKKALGITSSSTTLYISYLPDGSFKIGTDVNGNGGTPGTIEQLRQGYINVVKTGLSDAGAQTGKFQTDAEGGFYRLYGINDGQAIWNGWGTQKASSQPQPGSYYSTPDNVQSRDGNRVTYKDGTVWEISGEKLKKVK